MNPARLPGATALLAAGGLVTEVALTRILSAMFHSSQVLLVLSLAVLGLGIGAALGVWFPDLRNRMLLAAWASLGAVSALLILVVVHTVPLLPLILAVSVLPFIFIGLALSAIFSVRADDAHLLYWADLLGAGLGTVAAFFLLGLLGAPGSLLAGAMLLGVAALLLGGNVLALGLTAGALVLNMSLGWFMPAPVAGKPLSATLEAGGQVIASNWDAFARSDLVHRPDQDAHYLYVDGAAGSLVPGMQNQAVWRSDIGLLPFLATTPRSAFLLGPGGGLDVMLARTTGVQRVVAAELNAGGLELVAAVAPQIYDGIQLHLDEGRSVLRQLDEQFDLIFLSHVITLTSDARGYAMSEASVYSVEAFNDYLDHLTPGGMIALKLYDELTLTRALFTAVTAVAGRAGSEAAAMDHVFAALDTRTGTPLPLLLVSREPFTRDAAISLARTAEQLGFNLLLVPGLLANPPLDGLVSGESNVADLVAASALNLQPATDTRPFFFQFERGLPAGQLPLVIIVSLALVLALLFLRQHAAAGWDAGPLVFTGLGAGFMALELTVLQRSQLFLGHPALALTLVLGALLIGGGLGSLLGRRLFGGAVRPGAVLVLVLAVSWWFAWPQLAAAFQSETMAARVIITIASLLPLSLALGMPFPAALQRVGERPTAVAAGWALNGIASVAGSVGTIALAVTLGYPAAFGLAIACYLVVAVWGKATKNAPSGALG